MAVQQAETPGTNESTPATDGFLLIAKIKPGEVDALRAAVRTAAGRLSDNAGPLSQIGTVHFARLAIVGDYLVFSSHFDGDMIAYLDDFFSFTRGGAGFDEVLRYCEGWPGPNDRDGFVNFWTSHRVDDLFLYSYYPGVTCKEIEKALRVKQNMEAVLQDFQ